MDTRIVSQEVQDKVLGQVRKGQETMAGALRAAVAVAQSVTPPAPVLPPALASRLPSREELVSSAHDLADQLLAVQRKASELLDTQRVTDDLQAIQRRASELLDSQRKLADRAIDAVSPLLVRAGITTAHPTDAPAGIFGQPAPVSITKPSVSKASTTKVSTTKVSSVKTGHPRKAAAAQAGSPNPVVTKPAAAKKISTTKVSTTKVSTAKPAGTTKKPGSTQKPGPTKK